MAGCDILGFGSSPPPALSLESFGISVVTSTRGSYPGTERSRVLANRSSESRRREVHCLNQKRRRILRSIPSRFFSPHSRLLDCTGGSPLLQRLANIGGCDEADPSSRLVYLNVGPSRKTMFGKPGKVDHN